MEAFLKLLSREGVREDYPMIIVGARYRELKASTSLPIRRVTSKEELLDLISSYVGVSTLETPLLIEDMAFLSPQAHQQLLKFMEESKLKIVLLSTYDVFMDTILSRCKVFIKSALEKTVSEMQSPRKGRERIDNQLSQDTHPLDRVRYQGKISPLVYYNDHAVPARPNRRKILDLLE